MYYIHFIFDGRSFRSRVTDRHGDFLTSLHYTPITRDPGNLPANLVLGLMFLLGRRRPVI